MLQSSHALARFAPSRRIRTPTMPVEYDQAVTSLSACLSLDETKYWSDKADALAAWAKIYHSGDALRNAKCLKLHAFRRMGQIAQEINPRLSTAATGGRGSVPGSGPRSLLRRHNLSAAEVNAARMLAGLTEHKFGQLLKKPLAPTTCLQFRNDDGSAWHAVARGLMQCRSQLRQYTPSEVKVKDSEVDSARALVTEITEWIDEFESRLPKKAKH